jgi:hypothetical protein
VGLDGRPLPGAAGRPAGSAGPLREQRQPSVSDLANQQLRRGRSGDKLSQDMEEAARQDCLRPQKPDGPVSAGGLLAVPGLATKALRGECPQ